MEAAAKVCEQRAQEWHYNTNLYPSNEVKAQIHDEAVRCYRLIRALVTPRFGHGGRNGGCPS